MSQYPSAYLADQTREKSIIITAIDSKPLLQLGQTDEIINRRQTYLLFDSPRPASRVLSMLHS